MTKARANRMTCQWQSRTASEIARFEAQGKKKKSFGLFDVQRLNAFIQKNQVKSSRKFVQSIKRPQKPFERMRFTRKFWDGNTGKID